MRRFNWRNSWIGWFLNIHSPTAHAEETCWCIGTKRDLGPIPNFMTKSQALADMEAFYRYASAVADGATPYCKDTTCKHPEPHKHGFACDVTCMTCKPLTKRET